MLQEIRGFVLRDKAIPDREPTATSNTKPTTANAAKPMDLFCKSIFATRSLINDEPDLELHARHHICMTNSNQSSVCADSFSSKERTQPVGWRPATCWLATSSCKLHSCSTTASFTEKGDQTDRHNFIDT